MTPDGNLAFKVTWVYGEGGAWNGPCNAEGRDINVCRKKITWCSDSECICRQMSDENFDGDFDEFNENPLGIDSAAPCYDSRIFETWSFGAGYYNHGDRAGAPIPPFKHVKLGKLAFFTSRRIDMPEEDRRIIGCFRIGKLAIDPEFDMFEASAGDQSLKLRARDLERAPKYWDFHYQKGGPAWGTGLFRYIPDAEAEAMRAALSKAAVR